MGTAPVLLVQFWGEYLGLSALCTPFCCLPLQLPTLPLKVPLLCPVRPVLLFLSL